MTDDERAELLKGIRAMMEDATFYRIDDYGSADDADPDDVDEADIEVQRKHEATMALAERLLG